jgi:hypothetical protein
MCDDLIVDTAALFRKDMVLFPLPFLLNTINSMPNYITGVRYKELLAVASF